MSFCCGYNGQEECIYVCPCVMGYDGQEECIYVCPSLVGYNGQEECIYVCSAVVGYYRHDVILCINDKLKLFSFYCLLLYKCVYTHILTRLLCKFWSMVWLMFHVAAIMISFIEMFWNKNKVTFGVIENFRQISYENDKYDKFRINVHHLYKKLDLVTFHRLGIIKLKKNKFARSVEI